MRGTSEGGAAGGVVLHPHARATLQPATEVGASTARASDASHGATESGAKGVTGWGFHLVGGAVAWKARTQSLVALSSTDAELIAVAVDEAARELPRYLEGEQGPASRISASAKAPRPTPMGQDNMSDISSVGSTHFDPRSRHIALGFERGTAQQCRG
jgi:hypothetical protein